MELFIYTDRTPTQAGFFDCSALLRQSNYQDAIHNFRIDVTAYETELQRQAAELIAIQHVLFHPCTYDGMTINKIVIAVSSGQVKKALQHRANERLNQLAAPTLYRIEDIGVRVNNSKPSWFSTTRQQTLQSGPIYTNTHFPTVTSIGTVDITSTTIKNYRTHQRSVGRTYAELIREMQGSITKIDISPKAMKRKLATFGSKARHTINFKTQNGRHVFVLDTKNNVLITCYAK